MRCCCLLRSVRPPHLHNSGWPGTALSSRENVGDVAPENPRRRAVSAVSFLVMVDARQPTVSTGAVPPAAAAIHRGTVAMAPVVLVHGGELLTLARLQGVHRPDC